MHTVTVYSNWGQSKSYEFETLQEAYEFAEELQEILEKLYATLEEFVTPTVQVHH